MRLNFSLWILIIYILQPKLKLPAIFRPYAVAQSSGAENKRFYYNVIKCYSIFFYKLYLIVFSFTKDILALPLYNDAKHLFASIIKWYPNYHFITIIKWYHFLNRYKVVDVRTNLPT